jgi:hypothetical protein|tara:strand:+ start:214 stop:639 length:426 start_codon:yes stop_codon:yes gene_type:complete
MLATVIFLLVVSFVLVLMTAYWAWKSYQRHKLNLIVSDELHQILTSTHEIVKNSRKKITTTDESEENIMDSPEVMSTIITVLVSKYGTVRLSLEDFTIPDGEYVSVYVDTTTQEVILSLDHNLTLESQLVNFTKPDDTTFH